MDLRDRSSYPNAMYPNPRRTDWDNGFPVTAEWLPFVVTSADGPFALTDGLEVAINGVAYVFETGEFASIGAATAAEIAAAIAAPNEVQADNTKLVIRALPGRAVDYDAIAATKLKLPTITRRKRETALPLRVGPRAVAIQVTGSVDE